RDLEGHLGRLPVDGEVVLSAQKVVVDPGWMRNIRTDPHCLPSVVPFLVVLPGHRASPQSFAAQMMPHQALNGRTGGNAAAWAGSVDIELVAFRVLHPDRVVVEPFLGQCAGDGGAQAG